MDDRTRLAALPVALAAARPFAASLQAGLIVALYQHPDCLTAVLRLTPTSTAAGASSLVAATDGADAAVLIVLGPPRHTTALYTALAGAAEQIRAGGVPVAAEVAVRDFGDPVCWRDLDPRTPRDGTTTLPTGRARPPRWRGVRGCHRRATGSARDGGGVRR